MDYNTPSIVFVENLFWEASSDASKLSRELLGIQGYKVTGLSLEKRKARDSIILEIKKERPGYRCRKCGRWFRGYHSRWFIEVEHLMFWQYPTFLKVPRYRVKCLQCGLTTEPVEFIAKGVRVTHFLASLVYELCKVMTVRVVSLFQCLHKETVKAIDKGVLKEIQAHRSLEGIVVLGVDEIAVGKGHQNWTVISALEGPRGPEMLQVVEGRREKDLLKESFAHLWSYRSRTWALKFFRGWVAQLKWSKRKLYRRFVRMVELHLDRILAHCDKQVSLGYIEACNLKARNVIRRAYGYGDKEYMKLKIIQTCTPWMSQFTPWKNYHKILC